jgi:hypothetical protein
MSEIATSLFAADAYERQVLERLGDREAAR